MRLQITATNVDGTASAVSAATATIPSAAPANTTAPGVAGSAQRASTLTATQGAWNGIGNTYSYQWQRNPGTGFVNIAGATTTSYTVAKADEGATVRIQVSASNVDGALSAASTASASIPAAPPAQQRRARPSAAAPSAAATLQYQHQGTWSGIGNTYTTISGSATPAAAVTNIAGATGTSYIIVKADEGASVRALVTATNEDATLSAASVASVGIPASPPVNTLAPVLSGSAQRASTLSTTQGAWSGIGNTYSTQWQRNPGSGWVNIAGATASTYIIVKADETTTVRAMITATNEDASVNLATGASASIPSAPPVNSAAPVISGTPQRSFTLSTTQGTWTGIGNTYAYQWQRDSGSGFVNITGATDSSYLLGASDEATNVRVLVSASNDDATVSQASAAKAVTGAPPVNTVSPTVSGTAQRASVLSASTGTWTGAGNTYAYQWQRNPGSGWANIAGARDSSYTALRADEGASVRVLVSATNPDASASAASNATVSVVGAPPVSTLAPALGGIAQRGSTLSASQGTWSGVANTYSYQWQSNAGLGFVNLGGQTSLNYTVLKSDEGATLRMLVTAVNEDATVSRASAPTIAVAASPPVNTVAPAISGTAQRGLTLNATQGAWSGVGNSYAYQWQRDPGSGFTTIAGASTSTYVPSKSDEGTALRVLVSASNLDSTISQASTATKPVAWSPPANSLLPSISGTQRVGGTLNANPGAWTPADVSFSYSWQRADASTVSYQSIPSASAASYTLQSADIGQLVRVIVTATNADSSQSATSAATAPIASPPANTKLPAPPSGTLQDTSRLSADGGSWDSTATLSYAWVRCPADASAVSASCTATGTGSTYTLSVSDIGYRIAVNVTATSAGGSTTVPGALSAIVSGRPLNSVSAPSITGNPQVLLTLSVTPGTWSVTPTSVSYAWYRCDPDATSNCTQLAADAPSYTLSVADRNHTVKVIASATSPGGRSASATSVALSVQDQPLPQATVLPTVSGTAARTSTLSATPGNWTNSPTTVALQWQRCDADGSGCQPISGQSSSSYLLTLADEGHAITVQVSATNTSGTATANAKATAAVAGIPPISTHIPVIAGTPAQSTALLMKSYTWQTSPDTTFSYSWQRCDGTGSGCQPIAGASALGYTPSSADIGHTLIAVASASNPDGTRNALSVPSAAVLPAVPRWSALPTVSFDAGDIGDKLFSAAGVWQGPVVASDTMQWMRCTSNCVPAGAANTDYTIVPSDLGAILRVRETAANAGGQTVIWSSKYIGPVSSPAAGSAVLSGGQAAVRNTQGATLALAQLPTAFQANLAAAPKRTLTRSVILRRAAGVRGGLRAWACPLTGKRGGPPPACSLPVSLRERATLKMPAGAGGKIRVLVVRRGR